MQGIRNNSSSSNSTTTYNSSGTTHSNNNNCPSNFDRASKSLGKYASELRQEAGRAGKRVRLHGEDALEHGSDAVAHVLGASINAVDSLGFAMVGTGQVVKAGAHAVAAGGIGVAGGLVTGAEWFTSAGRWVAKNCARGFAAIANACSRVLGNRDTVTVRELEGDPGALRLSDKLFNAAKNQAEQVPESLKAAWNAYVQSVTHALGAGTNIVFVAGHTAAMAGHLAAAAAEAGLVGVYKLAQYGTVVAAMSMQAAEAGVEGARALAILSAEISAAAADLLAQPDQGEVDIDIEADRLCEAARLRVASMKQAHPAIPVPMPAAAAAAGR